MPGACDLVDLEHRRLERHHRRHRVGAPGRRIDAVEGDARAAEVVVEGGPEEDPGRVGEARRRRAAGGARSSSKRARWVSFKRVLRLLGDRQMAHHQDQIERLEQAAIETLELRPAEAQAAHPGIEMQRRRQALAAAAGEAGIADELFGVVEDRDQPGRVHRVLGAGRQPVQDMDPGIGQAARAAPCPPPGGRRRSCGSRPAGARPRPRRRRGRNRSP